MGFYDERPRIGNCVVFIIYACLYGHGVCIGSNPFISKFSTIRFVNLEEMLNVT